MTCLYYADGASYQRGIDLAGQAAFAGKATEGIGYASPAYAEMRAEAARHGTLFSAYHFLHAGSAAGQAAHCFNVTGSGVPLMIDAEPTAAALHRMLGRLGPGPDIQPHLERLSRVSDARRGFVSAPAVADIAAFTDAYRRAGGTVHMLYLPEWYWQQLGRPLLTSLAARGLHLVTSYYSGFTEAASGHGWQAYGGMPPVSTWQYTATGTVNGTPVDMNCFRGSGTAGRAGLTAELWSLWTAGALRPAPPPAPGGTIAEDNQDMPCEIPPASVRKRTHISVAAGTVRGAGFYCDLGREGAGHFAVRVAAHTQDGAYHGTNITDMTVTAAQGKGFVNFDPAWVPKIDGFSVERTDDGHFTVGYNIY